MNMNANLALAFILPVARCKFVANYWVQSARTFPMLVCCVWLLHVDEIRLAIVHPVDGADASGKISHINQSLSYRELNETTLGNAWV
jgi:hypothetical protein